LDLRGTVGDVIGRMWNVVDGIFKGKGEVVTYFLEGKEMTNYGRKF
jgi:hypothetical protein